MADHLQQQIVEAAKAILLAAATSANQSIHLERVDDAAEADLPMVHIEGGDEDVDNETVHYPAIQRRTFKFSTSCIVSGANYGKAARNLSAEVEAAFSASSTPLNSTVTALRLTGSTVQKDGSGAVVLFELRQQWQATYYTQEGIPSVLI